MNNEGKFKSKTYGGSFYTASNWNNKPIEERIKLLTESRKGQSMMGQFRPAPKVNYPTAENQSEKNFRKKMDAIYGAGQTLGIPWTDYKGVTHGLKQGEK